MGGIRIGKGKDVQLLVCMYIPYQALPSVYRYSFTRNESPFREITDPAAGDKILVELLGIASKITAILQLLN